MKGGDSEANGVIHMTHSKPQPMDHAIHTYSIGWRQRCSQQAEVYASVLQRGHRSMYATTAWDKWVGEVIAGPWSLSLAFVGRYRGTRDRVFDVVIKLSCRLHAHVYIARSLSHWESRSSPTNHEEG